MKNILFIASEGVPFIKTGGLAEYWLDHCRRGIDKEYYDVRVILPKYNCMHQDKKDMLHYRDHFYMEFNWKNEYVGILEANTMGLNIILLITNIILTVLSRTVTTLYLKVESLHFSQDCAVDSAGDRFQTGFDSLSLLANWSDSGISA